MPDRRSSPGRTLRKTVARFRRRGALVAGRRVVERAREELWSRGSIVISTRPTSTEAPAREDLRVRFADASDAAAYERDIGTDSEITFRARLTPGTRCLVVLDGDRIVHASWVTTAGAWMTELRRYFVPPPGDAYIYESFTHPDARGRGIYPLALATAAYELGTHGITTLWIAVESDNAPSLKAIAKAGFRPVCRASYKRRAGIITVETTPVGEGSEDTCWVVTKSLAE